jgi:hypothetical protein
MLLGEKKFHQISTDIGKNVSFKGKDFIFSFQVKQEKEHDCGGQYFKIMPPTINQTNFGG